MLVGIIKLVIFILWVVVVIGKILVIGCNVLLREIFFKNRWFLSKFGLICLEVVKIFILIGKLKFGFFLCKFVGVRLIRIFCIGK